MLADLICLVSWNKLNKPISTPRSGVPDDIAHVRGDRSSADSALAGDIAANMYGFLQRTGNCARQGEGRPKLRRLWRKVISSRAEIPIRDLRPSEYHSSA